MGTIAAIAIVGAATAYSAYSSSKAAGKAAKAQKKGAKQATSTELEMYYQGREDLAPWREGGTWALGQLRGKIAAGPGDYTKSPGYEFRLGEGVKARERGASAKLNVLSGEEAKALTRYGQDYATQDYDNFLSRYYQSLTPYQSMAGQGQTSSVQTAQMGQQTGQGIGQNYLAAGQARASGYINQANVASGAVSSGVENYLMYDYLKNRQPAPREQSSRQYL